MTYYYIGKESSISSLFRKDKNETYEIYDPYSFCWRIDIGENLQEISLDKYLKTFNKEQYPVYYRNLTIVLKESFYKDVLSE